MLFVLFVVAAVVVAVVAVAVAVVVVAVVVVSTADFLLLSMSHRCYRCSCCCGYC